MAEDDLSNLTDEELLLARDQVLEEFATALVRLHIACGAPPRSALAKQADKDGRCRLSTSTLSEVFNGKKIPGIDFTMELPRQLRPGDTALQDGWRTRWSEAMYTVKRAAKAQKRLEGTLQPRDRRAGDIGRLREEAAAELQRASLLRSEAEKALSEARSEAAAVLATAEQSARAVETRAAARAEKLLAEAQEEAAQIRRRAQQHVTPQGSESAVPDRALGPAEVLRLSLVNEFRTLTEPGSENWQALVRPELARSAEPVTLLRPDLGGLWRTLHLLALRLPVEDAARLRTRWRAMATDLFYGVDGDGLVPGLPGVVEPLPLRAPESVMTQLAIRDHAKALLARGGVTDVEMAGKLRYLFALIQEHASENRLLAQYDSGLVVALESLAGGNVLRIGTGDVINQYLRQVDAQLADLALSATHAPLHQHTLVNADEALAALLPDPVPNRDSWWHHRRRALQKKLTPYLASSGFEVQAHGTLTAVASDQTKKTNIASDKRTGDAILWWLRLPYRTQHGSWQKGRMIHEKLR
ncbi:hypothetical protein ACF09Y_33900 [Streptomyces massasporeus]|uniref:ATP synthase F0 subunit B n=1 Tax=Streptomyces massasporeus TaxID=67324 RepID=UPI0036FCC375